jgi:hypothetical protein
MKLRHATLALVAVLAAALLASGNAHASGVTGGFSAGSGYCWANENGGYGNRILATSPIISPAETNSIVGGSQLVGFFVTLQRWNGSAWALSQVSNLYTKQAAWGFDDGTWYSWETRSWTNGLTQFPIRTAGFYRLKYDYYWFNANETITGHTSSLSWGLRDDRYTSLTTTVWRYVDYCQY